MSNTEAVGMRRGRAEERYHPVLGRLVGAAMVAGLAVGSAAVALQAESRLAVAAAVGLGWAAVLAYLMWLRPVIEVLDDHLLLRNALSDTEICWHLVDDVTVRNHSSKVYVGTEAHFGPGAGGGLGEKWRDWRRFGSLGLAGAADPAGEPGAARVGGRPGREAPGREAPGREAPGREAPGPATAHGPRQVELRLLELARERGGPARAGAGPARVVRRRAVPQLMAAVLPAIVFVALLAVS